MRGQEGPRLGCGAPGVQPLPRAGTLPDLMRSNPLARGALPGSHLTATVSQREGSPDEAILDEGRPRGASSPLELGDEDPASPRACKEPALPTPTVQLRTRSCCLNAQSAAAPGPDAGAACDTGRWEAGRTLSGGRGAPAYAPSWGLGTSRSARMIRRPSSQRGVLPHCSPTAVYLDGVPVR
ncbi:hypothetical protein J1605_019564 [Eschrichtius robustus]|uniref:Uncharacterized protein n=1 Tax=Eschrichtius robustus TaxID=9764 RepID=A0AB34HME9_ESCRO|nr:hypothetical protein J1605_019564 [Eschrichtius robustus]